MKIKLIIPTTVLFFSLLLFSCVKDVDFNDADNIAITPVVELDLVYFSLNAQDFFDEEITNSSITLSDTTEIRFLDDTEVQESLLRTDFFFKFTNSIERSFDVDFQFISEDGQETYAHSASVNGGSLDNAVVTISEVTVEGQEILDLTGANRVVVNVTIPSSSEELEGTLKLQSKTTYYLEIKEQE